MGIFMFFWVLLGIFGYFWVFLGILGILSTFYLTDVIRIFFGQTL